jgi:putative sterol carrier protein
VPDFLSDEWFESLNHTLRDAGPVPMKDGSTTFRIVLEFPDAPSSGPHAMTFTLSGAGASLDAGDHLAADALVRLKYADALALATGKFDSATALREGRIKVRGDINAIVPLLSWLQQAHPQAFD